MAFYKWNVVDSEMTLEILKSYINGDDEYTGKVLEILSPHDIYTGGGKRYFFDRYTERKNYRDYDEMTTGILKNMGLGEEGIRETYALPEFNMGPYFIILDCSAPQGGPADIEDILGQLAKDPRRYLEGETDEEAERYLGALKEAMTGMVNVFLHKKPQINFMPIVDRGVFDQLWGSILYGNISLSGYKESKYSGQWFVKTDTGKYRFKHTDSDWSDQVKKYFMIRSIDHDTYLRQLDKALETGDLGEFSDKEIRDSLTTRA
jgi:hypothetical protein